MHRMFAWRRSALHRRVLVNLKSGTAVAGVLYAKRGPLLILKSAELIEATRVTKMDGEILIERANVDFVQAFEAGG